MKTNSVRLLEKLGIPYSLREYAVDASDLSAETVAQKIQLPIEQVFKTLAVKGDRHGVCFAVIPGNAELDLKALAKLSGNRKVDLAPLKEVQTLTGYVRGGVTALAGKKAYSVFLNDTCEQFDVISISAGVRGIQVLLNPQDYKRATEATVGSLTKTTAALSDS
jgi:Cys-tRNA(Pro)/Cys-tRNA(Cys) deacylase